MNGNFFLQNMFFIIVSMTFFTPFFAIEVSVFDSNNGFKKPVTDHLKNDNDYKALGKRMFKFLEIQDSNEPEYVDNNNQSN